MRTVLALACLFVIVGAAPASYAQYTAADTLQAVVPGLVYKEFTRTMDGAKDWRVTDPNAPFSGSGSNVPASYLPNPVLDLDVADLQGAIRAVAVIDVWGGHVGTVGKQFRLNGNGWIDVPDVQNTPGSPECYMHQATIEVEVPLSDVIEGPNTFEGTSGGQTCYNFGWGQWGWYSFMLRVYYDPAVRTPSDVQILSPTAGATMVGDVTIDVAADSPQGVARVEVIGHYRDYDIDGDGLFTEWQQHYNRLPGESSMQLHGQVGVAFAAPYEMQWDTTWVPDQAAGSIAFVARAQDTDGLWTVSEHVSGLSLERPGVSVRLYEPEDVPARHWVRAGWTATSGVDIPLDDDLSAITDAQYIVRTWNGIAGQAEPGEESWSRLNGWTFPLLGADHDYSIDTLAIPGTELTNGSNTITYMSESTHHGIEILWPGPAVMARFEDYTSVPATIVAASEDVYAVEGNPVTFSVTAVGEQPITYQWQRNGVDIEGATEPTYTIEAAAPGDDAAVFHCVVTNVNGTDVSPDAQLSVFTPGPRLTDGQVALYTFEEAAGDTVFDRSGVGTPVDLLIADTNAATWTVDGLRVDGEVEIASPTAAAKIVNAVASSGELTLEAWIEPANLTQNGPARIVSLSDGPLARNVTLGQGVAGEEGDRFDARLRSTETSTNGTPSLSTPSGTLTTELQHVVFTRTANGTTRILVDGIEQARGAALGDLSNWDASYRLAVGNEVGGGRPWLGTLRLVAIYDRAFTLEEVFQNFAAGPVAEDVATSAPTATRFALSPNVPNPFNPATTISFEIPARADVTLAVFDVRGRRVTSLVEGPLGAGAHRVVWNGRNEIGEPVSSGVYFYRLQTTDDTGATRSEARRMLLLK